MTWRIEHDVLIVGSLRVAVQRIGLGHWKPSARLRSWGIAPLHREGEALLVPCGAGEALWVGAWLEDGHTSAHVQLHDPARGAAASLTLPPDGQLTAIEDNSQVTYPLVPGPLATPHTPDRLTLQLRLGCGRDTADIQIVLLPPDEWAERCQRKPPAPLAGPPPLPPRLGSLSGLTDRKRGKAVPRHFLPDFEEDGGSI